MSSSKVLCVYATFTLVILKPESFVMGKTTQIVHLLYEHFFTCVYYEFVQLTHGMMHGIWGHQWEKALPHRALINCKAMEYSEVLVMVVKGGANASERLSSLKGSAMSERRGAHHLRTKLNAINIVLNYIHTSDCTEEMFREMSVIFSPKSVKVIRSQMSSVEPVDLYALVEDISKVLIWRIYHVSQTAKLSMHS